MLVLVLGLTTYNGFAFVDVNGDGRYQETEPRGATWVYLATDLVGITLRDPHPVPWLLLLLN